MSSRREMLRKANREHYFWQEMVVARTDISADYIRVAWRLALHRNVKTGRCDPSFSGLASGSGTSRSTVKRAIAEFERRVWIGIVRSKNKRNQYSLLTDALLADRPEIESRSRSEPMSYAERKRKQREKMSRLVGSCHVTVGPNVTQSGSTALAPEYGNTKIEHPCNDAPDGASSFSYGRESQNPSRPPSLRRVSKGWARKEVKEEQQVQKESFAGGKRASLDHPGAYLHSFETRLKAGVLTADQIRHELPTLQEIADEHSEPYDNKLGQWARRLIDDAEYQLELFDG